ncbi:hypothetical protein [Rosistilla oblonga]|uniref:hypothetical protein n=1 Tax=Rosistilla oblonga TaxID=2527990 RepID=UPI003A982EF2
MKDVLYCCIAMSIALTIAWFAIGQHGGKESPIEPAVGKRLFTEPNLKEKKVVFAGIETNDLELIAAVGEGNAQSLLAYIIYCKEYAHTNKFSESEYVAVRRHLLTINFDHDFPSSRIISSRRAQILNLWGIVPTLVESQFRVSTREQEVFLRGLFMYLASKDIEKDQPTILFDGSRVSLNSEDMPLDFVLEVTN